MLTEPNRFGGPESRRLSGGQQESPPRTHSGHQPPSSQPLHIIEGQSPGAPPIPPKGTPPSTTAGLGAFGKDG